MRGVELGWSSWIPRHGNIQTFTKHCGISSYQLDYWNPQRPALIWNKCWISSGPRWGLEPRGHFHPSRLLFLESGEVVREFFPAYSPLQFHSSLVPALPPLFLSFKKRPLYHSIFSSPLLCSAHCHPVESRAVSLFHQKAARSRWWFEVLYYNSTDESIPPARFCVFSSAGAAYFSIEKSRGGSTGAHRVLVT